MTCKDCKFRQDGRCHLNPPQAVAWPDQAPSGFAAYEITYRFPVVEDDDWCGQFKPSGGLSAGVVKE